MNQFTFDLDKTSLLPLYYQIKTIVLQEIHEKYWAPDEMIPTELEFMEYFSLSRTTIRQALNDLVKEKILYRKKGVGTFVSKPKINLQYMENSISFNDQILSIGLTPATKVLGLSVIPAAEETVSEMDISVNEKVILLTRVRYVENEPVALVKSFLPYELCASIMNVDLEKESLFQTLGLNEKTRVVRVTRLVEAQLATTEDCKLMQIEHGSPVQNFINKAYNSEGRIIEYSIARYRGDRNKFYVEINVK
jgi:GntR family transcriptional regulator